jgi:hypothetical protein
VAPVPIPRLRPLLTRKGVVVTAHVENPVPNSIVGHLLQLGEGHQVAIYTRRGAFWVAEFTDGESELLNAGTFFRFHARTLRYSSGCHAVALEPHVLEKIERLHQRREARDARIRDASLAVMHRSCVAAGA